jgi:SNF2 family DNA or RNA helicase
LIVCPATLKLVWKRELEYWLNRSFALCLVDTQSKFSQNVAGELSITIINYDRLSEYRCPLLFHVWDLTIFDECHYLKNPEAQRTQVATAIKAKRRVALSGTPLLNRPVELRSILSWLDPVAWPQDWLA